MVRHTIRTAARAAALFAASALGLALFGCAGDSRPEAGDGVERAAEEPQVAITFWRNSGNDAENAAYERLISTFMARHPGIRVEMTPIPYSGYDTKLRASIASGNPPDVMTIDAPNMASYVEADALEPLTERFAAEGNADDIPASTLSAYMYQGDMYMAPLTESSIALFYNKKMFEEKGIPLPSKDPDRPMTWDQVLDAAIRLTDREKGIYGIDPAQGFQNAGATAYFKYPIIWQFGGEVMNPEGTSARGYLDSPETKQAIRFYVDLYHKHKVSAFEYPPDPFPNGKLGMTVEGSWTLSHYAANFPDFELGDDYDIAPLPKAAKQAVANGSWALAISSASKKKDAAWTFVNWITGYEGQKLYVSITKDIPARYSVAKEIPELNEYPKNIFVAQNQKFGRSRPITPIFPQMSEAVNRMFEETTIGRDDIDAAIAEAVDAIDAAYADLHAQQ
ncbi:sugar ABC transporter substrate-binding protein [Paenibacillus sp.]|uniref:ABC transporter substrate-binding protein n=1 Tax=Paenibacillus sp. TaxID=58172 RepID=UPI002D37BD7B|nr:sugar ABC transporter substrate-binding protein [Paenibacillus sp.]HZG85827.1 sugar ABC transporter substrate-binding protein [Paenibacillus sp.]